MKPSLGKTIASPHHLVYLDVAKLIVSRLVLQADSGGGKSYAIRRICEQLYGLILQWIIDPEGEFGSLREKGDYVIVGGENGDIPATIEHVPALVRHLVELKVNVVFDLYELPVTMTARERGLVTQGRMGDPTRSGYVAALISALLALPKKLWTPILVVVDEAQDFAPEGGKEAASLVPIANLTAQGRKRGFVGVYATNAIARISKDALRGVKNYLIGSAALDADNKRAVSYLGLDAKGAMELKREMEPGQFFAFGPAISREVVKIMIGEVKTSHPSPGKPAPVVPAPPEKIRKVLAGLKELPKQVAKEAEDFESMKRRIVELKKELEMAKGKVIAKTTTIEVPVLNAKGQKLLERLEKDIRKLTNVMATAQSGATKVAAEFDALRRAVAAAVGDAPAPTPAYQLVTATKFVRSEPATYKYAPKIATPALDAAGVDRASVDLKIRILERLSFFHPVALTREQIGLVCDISRTTKSFITAMAELNASGELVTAGGRTTCAKPINRGPHPTWVNLDEPERRVDAIEDMATKMAPLEVRALRVLLESDGNAERREDLAGKLSISRTTKSFISAISSLASARLVSTGGGRIRLGRFILEGQN